MIIPHLLMITADRAQTTSGRWKAAKRKDLYKRLQIVSFLIVCGYKMLCYDGVIAAYSR